MTLQELPWSIQADYPILSCLQLLPLVAALLLGLLREGRGLLPLALSLALLELWLAIDLYRHFDPLVPAMQLAEWSDLPGPLNYHVAVDGMSLLFVLLNAVLTLLLILRGRCPPSLPPYRYLGLLFAAQSALMSLLLTMDLAWFVLVSALQLLPLARLLQQPGSEGRQRPPLRFLLHMGSGLLLLLAAALLLALQQDTLSFDLFDLAKTPLTAAGQSLALLLLFAGLAVRMPLFPLHGWLTGLTEHQVLVLLLGVKIGLYGLLRFGFILLPAAVQQWQGLLMAVAVAGMLFALWQVARREPRLHPVLLGHSSLLLIGLLGPGQDALLGSLLLSLPLGLAGAGLLLLTDAAAGSPKINALIRLAGLLAALSASGIPAYPALQLMLATGIHAPRDLLLPAAMLANGIIAGRLFWYRLRTAPAAQALAGGYREAAAAALLIVCLLGAALATGPWQALLHTSAQQLSLPLQQD